MALRKREVTFLICFRKKGLPRKGEASNPGGNYTIFIHHDLNHAFLCPFNGAIVSIGASRP